MSFKDVWESVEEKYKSSVLAQTFGHLAPNKNATYTGSITFSVGMFGDEVSILKCSFIHKDGSKIYPSPWFYDSLHDELCHIVDDTPLKSGDVYRWDGTFRNYKFKGKTTKLELS